MKLINNLKKFKLLVLGLSILVVSCDDTDVDDYNPNEKAQVSVTNTTATIGEGNLVSFTVNLSKPLSTVANIFIAPSALSTADMDDFEIMLPDPAPSAGDWGGQEGDKALNIPAFTTSMTFDVMVNSDFLIESDEVIILDVVSRQNLAAFVPTSNNKISLKINVEDDPVCLWTLEAVDTYGDSWNNASIDLTVDGTTTSYFLTDDDAGYSLINIPVALGGVYSFEFISGDWDGEIEYTLTSPDGTVYADAYYPAAGVITSGTSNCN